MTSINLSINGRSKTNIRRNTHVTISANTKGALNSFSAVGDLFDLELNLWHFDVTVTDGFIMRSRCIRWTGTTCCQLWWGHILATTQRLLHHIRIFMWTISQDRGNLLHTCIAYPTTVPYMVNIFNGNDLSRSSHIRTTANFGVVFAHFLTCR